MKKHFIKLETILNSKHQLKISEWINTNRNINELVKFLSIEFKIDCTNDRDIVKSYYRDWSNLKGYANALSRPINEYECALIMLTCKLSKIPITISAGRTNLNGSATPEGGMVLSIEKMKSPSITINEKEKIVCSPVGVYLEDMRQEVLKQSYNKLYYPVDPTSRKEAMVGGTLSCNASGFIPGPSGATRYWTHSLNLLTLSGHKISCKRGQYFSKNGKFILEYENKYIELIVPTYPRPNIKNASGPYSDENGKMDLVDLIVGSEGIFGLITSVQFRLKKMPNSFLDLFFTMQSEKDAIKFHKYLNTLFNRDLSNITALEYFGYNCQNYMKNKKYLFQSNNEVGIYLQIPLYNQTIEDTAEEWFNILLNSNCGINEQTIVSLNDSSNWKKFFDARHSIPVNALEKTKQLDTWSILTDTIVPTKHFQKFLNYSHKILKESNIEYLLFGHLGDCHLHFHFIPTKFQQGLALDVYNKIVEKSTKLGGVYSAEHGTGKRKRLDFIKCFGKTGTDNIYRTKSTFDPDFLLNRGNIIIYKNFNL